MSTIVQKYGGTSVSKEDSRIKIAKNAVELSKAGNKVVIVVSAMGRKGEPYATDTLIDFFKGINNVSGNHNLDLLMSCGENISSAIMANTIESFGKKAIALTGFQSGIITNDNFGDAKVIKVDPKNILEYLNKEYIVVVTGFQGVTEHGLITTLGRGGSDTTAAIIGEAIDADSIEIFTDVDGVMTADPRLVKNAKILKEIGYDEMYQMAVDGAKVVDSKAIAVAKRGNKPLIIKNTFNDENNGTVIWGNYGDFKDIDKIFTAITSKDNVFQIVVKIDYDDSRNLMFLDELEKMEIATEMINFFEDKKIFAFSNSYIEKVLNTVNKLGLEYDILENCSKVTAVGHNINGKALAIKKLLLSLSDNDIDILQTSDSRNTISCLIRKNNLEKAINILHDEFEL